MTEKENEERAGQISRFAYDTVAEDATANMRDIAERLVKLARAEELEDYGKELEELMASIIALQSKASENRRIHFDALWASSAQAVSP